MPPIPSGFGLILALTRYMRQPMPPTMAANSVLLLAFCRLSAGR
jgi:hypothetical protein